MKRKTKRIVSIALSLFMLFSLSGCSLYIVSVDKLMKAPMSDVSLEKTINSKLGSAVTMLCPSFDEENDEIEYLSSYFNYTDIDNDNEDEVITFYSPNSAADEIHILILKKYDNDKWKILSDTVGAGSEIISLSVVNINSKSFEKQIITTWKYVDKNILDVSSLRQNESGNYSLVSLCENKNFDEMKIVDVDNDMSYEFLTVSYALSEINKTLNPTVSLLSMNDTGTMETVSEIMLPSSSLNIKFNYSSSYPQVPFVLYFDYKNADDINCSNVIFWDRNNKKFISVGEKTGITYLTPSNKLMDAFYLSERSSPLICSDIDNDSFIEIPLQKRFSNQLDNDNVLSFTVWSQLDFSIEGKYLFSYNNDYRIYFDETNYFSFPAYFDFSRFYAYSNDNVNWSFYYGDFAQNDNHNDIEGYCFAKVVKIENSKLQSYENQNYALLGQSSMENSKSFVFHITDYGKQMNLTKKEIFNNK